MTVMREQEYHGWTGFRASDARHYFLFKEYIFTTLFLGGLLLPPALGQGKSGECERGWLSAPSFRNGVPGDKMDMTMAAEARGKAKIQNFMRCYGSSLMVQVSWERVGTVGGSSCPKRIGWGMCQFLGRLVGWHSCPLHDVMQEYMPHVLSWLSAPVAGWWLDY